MKIVTLVGARPQFVKAAVLRRAFANAGVEEILVHSGQHYDSNMSTVFFDEMQIRVPEYSLNLENRSHGGMTAEILEQFEKILMDEKPDWCLIYGDTNSTLAGALAASKLHIPICHVEAGLRSFNKAMPEEINRVVSDHVSSLLFCPTHEAIKNLENEGITSGVHLVGDIMYDAVKFFSQTAEPEKILDGLFHRDTSRKFATMTLHRQENTQTKEKLSELISYAKSFLGDYQIVFPLHPNTANKIKEFGLSCDGLDVIGPQSYATMQSLLNLSDLVITDSGGVQKEAYFHGVRCITMRDETEWVETISHGWNRLWTSPDYICAPKPIAEYGDGHSAAKMLHLLKTAIS